jgi:hypothetical protein
VKSGGGGGVTPPPEPPPQLAIMHKENIATASSVVL